MKLFTIIRQEYVNTGGDCMVLYSEVYLHDEDRTIYGVSNEDGVALYAADPRVIDSPMFCWCDIDMTDVSVPAHSDLVFTLFFDFVKRYGEIEVPYEWLTDDMKMKVPDWYILRVREAGDYVYVTTNGETIKLDEAYGPSPIAKEWLSAEKYCLTVSALRAFREAYMSLLEVWTDDVDDDLCAGYPFDRSFDEFNVHDWVNHALVNLEKRWQEERHG